MPSIVILRIVVISTAYHSLLMTSIVINCAGDNELARKINDYLLSKITSSDDAAYISLYEDELEIGLEKLGVSRESIIKLLQEFVNSNPEFADRYSVTEFDDVIVVGITKSLDEMVVNCEMWIYSSK